MPCRISTHVLDLQRGVPAANVEVELRVCEGDDWMRLAIAYTDEDGRVKNWSPHMAGVEDDQSGSLQFEAGCYQLRFATAAYFKMQNVAPAFFPAVTIEFQIDESRPHYHVPLLLSPFGYSTYRGS